MDRALLRKIPLFEELTDEELGEFAPFAGELSVAEGKMLVKEGDYSYDLMCIIEGTAEVTRDGQRIAELGPGDVFGEMGLLEKVQRNATVVATSSMRLVTLSSWDLRRMQDNAPRAYDRIRQLMAQRRGAAPTSAE